MATFGLPFRCKVQRRKCVLLTPSGLAALERLAFLLLPCPSLSEGRTRKEKEGAAGVHRRCKTLIMTQGFASSYHQLYLRCNILLTTQGTSQWSAHHATYPLGACVTNRQVGYSQIILLSSYRQYL